MLKIVVVEAGNAATVRLEGKVIGPWVEEVRRPCARALARGAALTLDLTDVSFVDRDGAGLLRSLGGRGAVLLNGSVFVGEQLKTDEPR